MVSMSIMGLLFNDLLMNRCFCVIKVSVRSYDYDSWTKKVATTLLAFNDQDIRYLGDQHHVAHAGIVPFHDHVDRIRPGVRNYASFAQRYTAGGPQVSRRITSLA